MCPHPPHTKSRKTTDNCSDLPAVSVIQGAVMREKQQYVAMAFITNRWSNSFIFRNCDLTYIISPIKYNAKQLVWLAL